MSQSRASDSPVLGEGMEPERPSQTENIQKAMKLKIRFRSVRKKAG